MKGTQDIAGYRILAKMGEGAASQLYAVQDPKSKQVYALKHVTKLTDRDHRFIEQVEDEYEVVGPWPEAGAAITARTKATARVTASRQPTATFTTGPPRSRGSRCRRGSEALR